tara:strand:+ start:238 stop:771 length:534 start_codon:yes stop_codon:yes gene_type:complete
MRVIALTGPKTVGKTTVASAIADNVDKVVYINSFADPMRAMLEAIGVDSINLLHQSFKEEPIEGLGKSARELLQTLGTEWGRAMVSEDIWLWAMSSRMEEAKSEGVDIVVIDDCRFDNEADWVSDLGGSVILLKRDGHEYGEDKHSTEQPIDESKIDLICDASDQYKCAKEIIEYAT